MWTTADWLILVFRRQLTKRSTHGCQDSQSWWKFNEFGLIDLHFSSYFFHIFNSIIWICHKWNRCESHTSTCLFICLFPRSTVLPWYSLLFIFTHVHVQFIIKTRLFVSSIMTIANTQCQLYWAYALKVTFTHGEGVNVEIKTIRRSVRTDAAFTVGLGRWTKSVSSDRMEKHFTNRTWKIAFCRGNFMRAAMSLLEKIFWRWVHQVWVR